MGLFNSNKRGNTSRRTTAEGRRGDLHTPPLVSKVRKNDLTQINILTKTHMHIFMHTQTLIHTQKVSLEGKNPEHIAENDSVHVQTYPGHTHINTHKGTQSTLEGLC